MCQRTHLCRHSTSKNTHSHTLSLRLVEQMWRRQQMCNVHPSIMEASHSWQGKQLSEWEIDGLLSLCSTLTILTPSSHSFSSFSSVFLIESLSSSVLLILLVSHLFLISSHLLYLFFFFNLCALLLLSFCHTDVLLRVGSPLVSQRGLSEIL